MKVVFFSKGGFDVVSSRYRCFYFAEALAENGIETQICDPPPRHFGLRPASGRLRELLRLIRELARVEENDIAYIQRAMHNQDFVALLALWKKLLGRKMIFDFCDPVFTHSPWKTKLLVRLADAVVVSCEDLAEWARLHHRAVHVIPNCPKPGVPRSRSRGREHGSCVVGWAGSAKDHRENVRLLFPILAKVSGNFTFRLIGARGADDLVEELQDLDIACEVIEWVEPENAAGAVADLDIAVLPVRDTLWNRKLLTKLIDYLAAGLPIVASPVGENRFAIVDGKNGFLAATEGEWVEKLDLLLADRELRRRLGRKAQETIQTRYSLADNGKRLASLLRTMTEDEGKGSA